MNYYIDVLKKYAVFDGRARRKEYWMFALCNLVIALVLTLILHVLGIPFLIYLYSLAVFLPSLGVSIRRLHDIGRTGWWFLIGFIPLIGAIVLLVFFVTDSQPGSNEYGPDPKGA